MASAAAAAQNRQANECKTRFYIIYFHFVPKFVWSTQAAKSITFIHRLIIFGELNTLSIRTDGTACWTKFRGVCAFHALLSAVPCAGLNCEYSGIFLSIWFDRIQESKVKVIAAGCGKLSANMLQHSEWRNSLKPNLFFSLSLFS